jgi:hypothetical protein
VADNYGLATIGIRAIEICGALPMTSAWPSARRRYGAMFNGPA